VTRDERRETIATEVLDALKAKLVEPEPASKIAEERKMK
jgi:hypothetical protein